MYKIEEKIIENFNNALKYNLLNESSVVEIKNIDFNNLNATVYVDQISVGKVFSYFEDIKLLENECLYFLPSLNYFNLCKRESIDIFLEKTSNIFKSILLSFDVENINDESIWNLKNEVTNFNFNFREIFRSFKINFGSNTFKFNELGRLTYKLVKKDDRFIVEEDFSFTISNLLSLDDVFKKFSCMGLFSLTAIKNNEDFYFFDSGDKLIKKINLNNSNETEILKTVEFILFYYLANKVNIDIKDISNFQNNIKEYKDLIKIALI